MGARRRTTRWIAATVLAVAALAGCSDDGADDGPSTSSTAATSSTSETTSTTSATSTSGAPTTVAPTAPPTTAPPATVAPPTTVVAYAPGDPCPLGSHRDCIDPEGDGTGVFLIGGGDCMASPIGGGLCADLDGDGRAGYPDSG